MIKEIDLNNDNVISLDEFLKKMKNLYQNF